MSRLQSDTQSSRPGPRKGRPGLTLALVFLAFAGPMLAAWLVLTNEAWRPTGLVVHGNLVQPARPLPSMTLKKLDGSPAPLEELRGRWTLVYVAGSSCGDTCRESLYKMRQVRLAVGEDTPRVQRLMVLTHSGLVEHLGGTLEEHPDLSVVTAEGPVLETFLSSMRVLEQDQVPTLERIYIVDPIGNLMMYYEAGAPAKGMLKDLERLLKASQIG